MSADPKDMKNPPKPEPRKATPTELALATAITELRTLRLLKATTLKAPIAPDPSTAERVRRARRNLVSALANAITEASPEELRRLPRGRLEQISAFVELGLTGPEEDTAFESEIALAISASPRSIETDLDEVAPIAHELGLSVHLRELATTTIAREVQRARLERGLTLAQTIAAIRALDAKASWLRRPRELHRQLLACVHAQRPGAAGTPITPGASTSASSPQTSTRPAEEGSAG